MVEKKVEKIGREEERGECSMSGYEIIRGRIGKGFYSTNGYFLVEVEECQEDFACGRILSVPDDGEENEVGEIYEGDLIYFGMGRSVKLGGGYCFVRVVDMYGYHLNGGEIIEEIIEEIGE